MRTRGLVPLTLTIALLASAGLAAGHAATGYDGWSRALHDCNDDWQDPHEEGQSRSGHDLVALDVQEGTAPDGTRAVGLRLTMDLGFAQDDPEAALHEYVNFTVNRTSGSETEVSTRISTADNLTFVAGGKDAPLNPAPERTNLSDDDGRFHVDLWYSYDQLGIDNGDKLTSFFVQGMYGTSERDDMPGAYTATGDVEINECLPGTEETRQDSKPFEISQAPGQPPQASFSVSPDQAVTDEEITFNDTSTDADNNLTAWSWDLGDGTTKSTRNVTHAYDEPGTYTVELTVTDERGNEASTTQDVTVADAPPEAAFAWTPQEPEAGQTVSFSDGSTDPEGSLAHAWTFGDGATSTAANPDHVYEAAGTYEVTLNVTDSQGQEATVTHEITVVEATPDDQDDTTDAEDDDGDAAGGGGGDGNQDPVAAMQVNPENPLVGQTVTFRDVSNDPDGEIASRSWTFGDQVSSQKTPTNHSYAEPGEYTVTLTVTDDQGATNTTTVTIEVLPADSVSGEDEALNQTAAEADGNGTNATSGNESANGVPGAPLLAVLATLAVAAAARRR